MATNKWHELLIKNRGGKELLPPPLPELQSAYNSVTSNSVISPLLTGPLNKMWRAKILINRLSSKMEKVDTIDNLQPEATKTTNDSRIKRDDKLKGIADVPDNLNYKPNPENISSQRMGRPQSSTSKIVKNQIILVNTHTTPVTRCIIQAFSTVEMNSESVWAAVKSIGRNNPFYIYNGSEDTITLEISWYALDNNREDVINKCRLLESWTKADGYAASPPTLGISWGNSDLFSNDYFILVAAPYKPTNFQNSYRKGNRKDDGSEVVDLLLLPNSATQNLTFKRVTSNNRSHSEIIPVSKQKTTTGIIL